MAVIRILHVGVVLIILVLAIIILLLELGKGNKSDGGFQKGSGFQKETNAIGKLLFDYLCTIRYH